MALIVGGVTVTGTQTLDATKLSGNLPALNGSSLTNLPASTPSNSDILSGVASATAGAVGGYIFAQNNATQSPNATFSGNNEDYKYGGRANTNIPSGTYRVMGETHSSTDATRRTVALRISQYDKFYLYIDRCS